MEKREFEQMRDFHGHPKSLKGTLIMKPSEGDYSWKDTPNMMDMFSSTSKCFEESAIRFRLLRKRLH